MPPGKSLRQRVIALEEAVAQLTQRPQRAPEPAATQAPPANEGGAE